MCLPRLRSMDQILWKRLSSIDGGIDSITVDSDELARHVGRFCLKMAGDLNITYTVSTPLFTIHSLAVTVSSKGWWRASSPFFPFFHFSLLSSTYNIVPLLETSPPARATLTLTKRFVVAMSSSSTSRHCGQNLL